MPLWCKHGKHWHVGLPPLQVGGMSHAPSLSLQLLQVSGTSGRHSVRPADYAIVLRDICLFGLRRFSVLRRYSNLSYYAIPNSSISKISIEPAGMPGCENLPLSVCSVNWNLIESLLFLVFAKNFSNIFFC